MSRLRSEDGFAIAPAMAVMVIVLALGAAVLTTVNVQSNQTRVESAGEGAFEVADSALNSHLLNLSRSWPTSSAPYPACNQASTATTTCMGTALATNFTTSASSAAGPNGGSNFSSGPTWSARVIDDVGGSGYYNDTLSTQTPAPCACDANGNGKVWVRAEASVGGRRSVIVSLAEQGAPQREDLPTASIIAGWFNTTNNGKKVIVDAQGSSATAGVVNVRCNPDPNPDGPDKDDSCLGYDPGKGQLAPSDAYETGYVDGTGVPNATNRRILDAEALARLKARAQSLGTYFATGCPPTLAGTLVYVENPTNATCPYTSNGQYNSSASPGVIIFAGGQLSLGGNSTYNGLIYMANRQGQAPASGPCTAAYRNLVVDLLGGTVVRGAILVDKCGGVNAGSSGESGANPANIVFDSRVFGNVVSNGIAGGVKNSYRIIPTS